MREWARTRESEDAIPRSKANSKISVTVSQNPNTTCRSRGFFSRLLWCVRHALLLIHCRCSFPFFAGDGSLHHAHQRPALRAGALVSCFDSLPRKMSPGRYRRLSPQSGHCATIHEAGMVSTGAGIFAPQRLQQMVKSWTRDGGRRNTVKL